MCSSIYVSVTIFGACVAVFVFACVDGTNSGGYDAAVIRGATEYSSNIRHNDRAILAFLERLVEFRRERRSPAPLRRRGPYRGRLTLDSPPPPMSPWYRDLHNPDYSNKH